MNFKRKIYNFFKSKNAYLFFVVLFFAITIIISAVRTKGNMDIGEIIKFDMVASVSITGIIGIIIAQIVKLIENKLEDSIKLNDNYPELIERYTKEKFINYNEIIVPISVISKCDKNTKVIIEDNPQNEFSLPYVCKSNFNTLYSAHKHSKVYNAEMARLDDYNIDVDSNTITLNTGRTNFFNSLVTNRACDYQMANNLTIRNIFEYKQEFSTFNKSYLSNHLGINGFVITADGKYIFIKRGKDKSIAKNKLGNTYGFGLRTDTLKGNDGVTYDEALLQADAFACKLLKQEKMGITAENIAFIRTATECGKPSLVINLHTGLSEKEIVDNISKNLQKKESEKLIKSLIFATENEIDVIDNTTFTIYGKRYPSTPDCVAEYILCAKKNFKTIN